MQLFVLKSEANVGESQAVAQARRRGRFPVFSHQGLGVGRYFRRHRKVRFLMKHE